MWWFLGPSLASRSLLAQDAAALELDAGTLWVGDQVELVATGALAGEQVRFVRGASVGAGPCPAVIGGTCLDVVGPVSLLGAAVADATGQARLMIRVPVGTPPGLRLGLQAVVIRGVGGVDSVVSPGLVRTVPEPCSGYRVPEDYATLADAMFALWAVGGTVCLGSGSFDAYTRLYNTADIEVVGVSRDETKVGELDVDPPGGAVVVRDLEADDIHMDFATGTLALEDVTVANLDIQGAEATADRIHVECRDLTLEGIYLNDADFTLRDSYVTGCQTAVSIPLGGNANTTMALFNNTFSDSDVGIDAWVDDDTFSYANNIVTGMAVVGVDLHKNGGTVLLAENNALFGNATNYAGLAVAGPGYVTSDCQLDGSTPPVPARGSGCVGGASLATATSTDFHGRQRDAAPDIGAVERP